MLCSNVRSTKSFGSLCSSLPVTFSFPLTLLGKDPYGVVSVRISREVEGSYVGHALDSVTTTIVDSENDAERYLGESKKSGLIVAKFRDNIDEGGQN